MPEKNTYRLLNPYIEGTMDTVVKARNSFSAGKKLYNTISNYFTNHVDDFYMTLQNVETGQLSHFKIGERRDENGAVDFEMIKLDKNFTPDLEKQLINNVNKIDKQSGGRKNIDDSDTEFSSESECFRFPLQPITKFIYFYLPYYKLNLVGLNPLDIARIFMPTFGFIYNPSIEIRFDLYRYF
ncbi:hypothetical protein QJ854_gp347 [Moumouvirus goulette]|uniref:Uncharacterized protein n=1 Tax=Moumouvirus goulette TaxID=1247379 RepID=M1NN27_9VIRU|nr:hypothetical protein QJ854_gp347 [Moumouvirus goulette]AGF85435.1 hypothetical protein glt_00626 [Moumouvirus goulette]